MTTARLLIDDALPGAWNMAVDQTLLASAAERGEITLRFYRWQQPTLSLGYFQRAEDRQQHTASLSCEMVRRRTGGGAILHDRELTYSLAIPNSNRWSAENAQLYDLVHHAIIGDLNAKGLAAHLHAEAPPAGMDEKLAERPVVSPDAFLCFRRRSDGDVVLGGWKVVGSAQRRQKRSLLQHGSILLERSEFAPELPGISQLANGSWSDSDLQQAIVSAVEESLQIEFNNGQLSGEEEKNAGEVERSFLAREWIEAR